MFEDYGEDDLYDDNGHEHYGEKVGPWDFEVAPVQKLANAALEFGAGFERLDLARFTLDGRFPIGSRSSYYAASKFAPRLGAIELGFVIPSLANFQDCRYFAHLAGVYISACVNNSLDKNLEFDMSWSDQLIHNIGMNNHKNVVVEGDVGDYLGRGMEHGILRVNGRYGSNVGIDQTGGDIQLPMREKIEKETIEGLLFGKIYD